MTTPYTSWLASWGPLVDLGVEINTGEQTQNVTAFNGTANQNYGDAVIATSQNVGDVEVPSIGSLLDASLDINTGIQDQTVTAFNGEGNTNAGCTPTLRETASWSEGDGEEAEEVLVAKRTSSSKRREM